ncbi:MAG: SAM-dependent methyltransferase, partial [Chloroflexota bacterium]
VMETRDEPVTGVLIANELLDALPFHRLAYRDGNFSEHYVTWKGDWFAGEAGPLSEPDLIEPIQDLPLQEGQLFEVSPAAQEWVAGLAERIERGFAILIDYGYPAGELYGPERAEGTLRTYRQHLVGIDPYQHVGRQDITAHVDFSAMIRAAERAGLSEIGLTTQAFFFAGLGIEEILMEIQRSADDPYRYVNAREAVMHLMDPRGLGRFRVLILGKDVPRDVQLRGLSFSIPGFPH